MEASTLIDAKVAEACDGVVPFVAHGPTEHGTIEVEENGRKVTRCSLYTNLECADHVRNSDVVGDYFQGRLRTPSMVWVDCEGKELFRKAGYRRPLEFLKDLRDALSKVPGARIAKPDYQAVYGAIEEGLSLATEGKWRDAVKKLRISDTAPKALRDKAVEALGVVRKIGEDKLDNAKAFIKSREFDSAKMMLKAIAEDFQDFDTGVRAAELLKSFEK